MTRLIPPLRVLIPMSLLVFSLAGSGAISYLLTVLRHERTEEAVLANHTAELNRLRTTLEYLLRSNDNEMVGREVALIATIPDVRMAALFAPDGTVMAATRLDMVGRRAAADGAGPPALASHPLLLREDVNEVSWATAESGLRIANFPVILGNNTLGTLYVEFDLAHLNERSLWEAQQTMLLTAALVTLIAFALWLLLDLLLTRRVHRIARAAAAFADGDDHARSDVSGGDELGHIGSAFDAMAARIQANRQELRESEERYRSLIEQAADAIVLFSPDGRYLVDANLAACNLLEQSRDTLLSRDPGEIGLMDAELLHRLEAGETCSGERSIVSRSRPLDVEISARRLSDGYLQMIVRDIRERKAADARLEAMRRLNTLYAILNAAILRSRSSEALFGELGRILVEEAGFRRVWFGRLNQRGEVMPQHVYPRHATVQPYVLAAHPEMATSLLAGERYLVSEADRSKDFCFAVPLMDGAQIRYVLHISGLREAIAGVIDHGNLERLVTDASYMLGLLAEEERRRAAETALAESERFAKATVDALTAQIAIVDENGAILRTNASWRRFSERNGGDPLATGGGANYLSVCDAAADQGDEAAAEVARGLREVLAGVREEFIYEYSLSVPPRTAWYVVRITKFPDDGPVRAVIAHSEITEQKIVEEWLRELGQELEHKVVERTVQLAEANERLAEDIRRRGMVEKALRESEQRLSLIYQATSDLIFLMEVEENDRFRCVSVNNAYLQRTGLGEDQLLGRYIEDILPPEAARFVIGKYREALHAGAPIVYEESVSLPAGQVQVETRLTPIFDGAGRCTHLMGSARDITHQRKAERDLLKSRERLQGILELADDAIITMDAAHRIVLFNKAAERIFGYSADEALGMPLSRLLPDRHAETHAEAVRRFEGQGVSSRAMNGRRGIHGRRRSGEEFPAEASVSKLIQDGTVLFTVFLRDVTQRALLEEAERSLRAAIEVSELEWRKTFDAVDFPVFIADATGHLTRSNEAGRLLRSRSVNRAHSNTLADYGKAEPWASLRICLDQAAATSAPAARQVADCESGRAWEVAATVFQGPGGERRMILLARDVTSRVELEQKVRHAETMSALGRIVAGVSHEVRNPLFSISACLDAMNQEFAELPEIAEYVTVLRSAVDRLQSLASELLDYGRPRELDIADCAPAALVGDAVRSCSALAHAADVRLEWSVEPGLGKFRADASRLRQALENLIQNAIQHSPAGATVRLRLARGTGERPLRFVIEDQGPGFPAADLHRIFEPFFTRRRGGTGLGLSIVQRFVEHHGGNVTAENREDGGARVVMELPLSPPDGHEFSVAG